MTRHLGGDSVLLSQTFEDLHRGIGLTDQRLTGGKQDSRMHGLRAVTVGIRLINDAEEISPLLALDCELGQNITVAARQSRACCSSV